MDLKGNSRYKYISIRRYDGHFIKDDVIFSFFKNPLLHLVERTSLLDLLLVYDLSTHKFALLEVSQHFLHFVD